MHLRNPAPGGANVASTREIMMLSINSCPSNIERVELLMHQISERFRIAPDVYGNILISLTEAVNNAIIHGNGNDVSKKVQIVVKRDNAALRFEIKDEGPGFNHECLPDPTAPENLYTIGGRGVFLMKQLSDSIRFDNNGNTIEMSFCV
jgi:serine/threonine-protein kinase RsbW